MKMYQKVKTLYMYIGMECTVATSAAAAAAAAAVALCADINLLVMC
jgi:hypothetical protein